MDEDLTIDASSSVVPVYRAELSDELIASGALWEQQELQRKLSEDSKEQAKISALAKLSKLGLTEEEAKAVIGL